MDIQPLATGGRDAQRHLLLPRGDATRSNIPVGVQVGEPAQRSGSPTGKVGCFFICQSLSPKMRAVAISKRRYASCCLRRGVNWEIISRLFDITRTYALYKLSIVCIYTNRSFQALINPTFIVNRLTPKRAQQCCAPTKYVVFSTMHI